MKKGKRKVKNELSEVLEIVNYLKDNMATKGEMNERFAEVCEEGATKRDMVSGFLRIEERLSSMEQELKDIKRRLVVLEDKFKKHRTVTKSELDDLWRRVIAIEKQLKMRR